MSKKILIGKITGAHGVKGLVKILPYGEDLSLLEQVTEYKITLKNRQGPHVLAAIEGVNDRNAAEGLRGTAFFIPREQLPEIEDGAFYYEDLIGMKAVDVSGTEIGMIIAVHNFGAGDLLDIQPANGPSFMVPFTPDFVVEVAETVRIQNYEAFQ